METMRILPILATIAVLIGCGIVHGLWTDRWTRPAEPEAITSRFERLPTAVGDWQGNDLPVSPRELQGLSGYLVRRYVHQQTGEAVTVALMSGRPRVVAIHTPDACYGASGFDVSLPTRHTPADLPEPAEFWTTDMVRTRAAEQTQLRIFYAWNAAGTWAASDNPRFTFAGRPLLYKLYLLRDLPLAGTSLDNDPCLELMKHLQPELKKCLFPENAPL
jgi:hypothetical protein